MNSAPARNAQSKLCVLVAGMHRSGTSAVTRVINILGAAIASDLWPASIGDNDRGFWESTKVIQIHEELLQGIQSSYDDPLSLPDGWIKTKAAQRAEVQIAEFIKQEFGDSSIFVVKDPRISRLLPLWLKVLDKLKIKSVVVLPLRNPLEIAGSLRKRNGFAQAKSLLMYTHCNLEAELASRDRPRLFVSYEQLLDDWRPFAERFKTLVGPRLRPQNRYTVEIDNFLTTELHRNISSREDFKLHPEMSASAIEIFDRTTAVVNGGDEAALRGAFDRLRDTLAEADRLFRGLVVSENEKHLGVESELRREIELLRTENEAQRTQSCGNKRRIRSNESGA